MRNTRILLPLLLASAALVTAGSATAQEFPLKDGDIWVMAGDSITAQHLHSNYFEAFCFARYPKLKFAFRNSGVGGHTIPSTLARFHYDIAAWKPTIVSVELGMNDKGSTPTDKFIANMDTMVERIRSLGARPVILAPSPVNNGETMANLNSNKRLHEYADALREFCAREKIPYADQFHDLVDVWGKNKPREALANSLASVTMLAKDDKLAGVEHLREFVAAQKKNPAKLVSMQGDAVHPGAPGQLMMAASLLKRLGAAGFVSSATVAASGSLVEAKGCKVEGIKAVGGTLSFDRLDECLPFPIPDEARGVLSLDPTILEMSQYTLKVTGLKNGQYALAINGAGAGILTSKELEAGVNLTDLGPNSAIAAQGKAILGAIAAKAGLVAQWRGLSQKANVAGASAELKDQLAKLTRSVEEADARVREAARPRTLHFDLTTMP